MSSKAKVIDSDDQRLLTHATANSHLFVRLLSPIIENSSEILSTSLPFDKTWSDSSRKSTEMLLKDNKCLIDDTSSVLLQRFYQYRTNFYKIENHLHSIKNHLIDLNVIIEHLQDDQTIRNLLEPIVNRLIQIRVKTNQIDRCLEQSSIENFTQQVSDKDLNSAVISFFFSL